MKNRIHFEFLLLAAVLCLCAHLGFLPVSLLSLNPAWLAGAGLAMLSLLGGEPDRGAVWLPAMWQPVSADRLYPPALFLPEDPVSCEVAAASVDGSFPPLQPQWSG